MVDLTKPIELNDGREAELTQHDGKFVLSYKKWDQRPYYSQEYSEAQVKLLVRNRRNIVPIEAFANVYQNLDGQIYIDVFVNKPCADANVKRNVLATAVRLTGEYVQPNS